MNVTSNKYFAAIRQLDVAIELLFSDREPLAVRTLAAASHGLLSDLVESKRPGESWRKKLISDSGLPRKQAIEAINGASNFLKHADRDPEGNLAFDEEENDILIFIATIECGELGAPLSYSMQAFQIWYLACYPNKIGTQTQPVQKARAALPSLAGSSREIRLHKGLEFLAQVLGKYAAATL